MEGALKSESSEATLRLQEADFGVGQFTVTSERSAVVDFMTPFWEEHLTFLIKIREQDKWLTFAHIFHVSDNLVPPDQVPKARKLQCRWKQQHWKFCHQVWTWLLLVGTVLMTSWTFTFTNNVQWGTSVVRALLDSVRKIDLLCIFGFAVHQGRQTPTLRDPLDPLALSAQYSESHTKNISSNKKPCRFVVEFCIPKDLKQTFKPSNRAAFLHRSKVFCQEAAGCSSSRRVECSWRATGCSPSACRPSSRGTSWPSSLCKNTVCPSPVWVTWLLTQTIRLHCLQVEPTKPSSG